MFARNRVFDGRLGKWGAATLMLAAAASVRADDTRRPTNQEQLRQFHADWVAAGKPMTATSRPKWGTAAVEVMNVHAYEFQGNTSTNLIVDDGNGYRYFGDEA